MAAPIVIGNGDVRRPSRRNSRDSTDQGERSNTITESTKGDSKYKTKELKDEVASLKQQVKELQSSNEQLLTQGQNDREVQDLKVKRDELTVKLTEKDQLIRLLEAKIQELQSSNDELKHANIECESLNDSLSQEKQDWKDEINRFRDALKEACQSIRSLEAEVKELKRKVADYERDRDKLYLCQVAVEFERAICSHVIPEVFSKSKSTASANIDSLLNMLNSGDEGYVPLDPVKHDIKAILSRARPRWEKLCDDLKLPTKWKKVTGKEVDFTYRSVPCIFRTMALLKRERNPVAHPTPVSLQEAKKKVDKSSIRNDFEYWEFELVKEFILSLQMIIKTSGIQTDQGRFILD